MCRGCGIQQGVAMEKVGGVYPHRDQERLRALCGHPIPLSLMGNLAGSGKGVLTLDGWMLPTIFTGSETPQHWPKEQVSRLRHICGLLENALETETSKTKDEESGPGPLVL